jgi:ketosteroid isomerase-like protein
VTARRSPEAPAVHPHAELIERFYAAFARRDAGAMSACYHPEAEFSDPVFPALRGAEVGGMWRMLCARGADLRVEYRGIAADDATGRAHWEAWYTFSATGRAVHNVIDAEFTFRDGLVLRHRDRFDFHRWTSQALGPVGRLLGWSPIVKRRVRGQAAAALARFLASDRAVRPDAASPS